VVVRVGAGVRAAVVVAERVPAGRMLDMEDLGLGVMLWSAEGRRDFFWAGGAGVLKSLVAGLGLEAEASDIGGDGGSWETALTEGGGKETSSLGGVVISGELAVERGEFSKMGDSRTERSVDMVERWWCLLILSCIISASTLRSDSSSRRR
jgi:hypothetical protein